MRPEHSASRRPAGARRPLRIVCYAVNGAGLGHVTRLLHIARWMRRVGAVVEGRVPEVIFLTSTEATQLISDAGFAAFKLPSKGTARGAHLDVPEYRRLARQFVWQVLSDFSPDLLVVDTFAQGSLDELFPILDAPYARGLVLRHMRPEQARRPIFQASYRFYDAVVFPHPAAEVQDLLAVLPQGPRITAAGHIHGADAAVRLATRAALRAELGLPESTPLLYVSAGGGGDPQAETLLHALVEGVRAARPDAAVLVGAGPLFRGRRLFAPGVIWHVEPGVARLFPACDGAISAAGYNTFHELLAAGVPSAFFGLEKIADDQAARVARYAVRGACLSLALPLEAGAIGRAVATLLGPRAPDLGAAASSAIGPSAAPDAAAALLEPLLGPDGQEAVALLDPRLMAALDGLGTSGDVVAAEVLPRLFRGLPPDVEREVAQRLLPGLSAGARAEVEGLLASRGAPVDALRSALIDLLEMPEVCADAQLLVSAFDGALRRPLPRVGGDDGARLALVDAVRRLFSEPSPLALAERVSLFRVFPPVSGVSAEVGFDAFASFLAEGVRRNEDAATLTRRLQLLKLGGEVTLERVQRAFEVAA